MSSSSAKAPKDIAIVDFNYHLPDASIARYPIEPRDGSKLLIYKNEQINTDYYNRLHEHIPANSLLVMNNTKVVEARLLFKKKSGGMIEIFCLEPDEQYSDITTAMLQKDKVVWKCLVGNAKKWKEDFLSLSFMAADATYTLKVSKKQVLADCVILEFKWDAPELSFAAVLHHAGIIPLPPYLKRETEEKDNTTYQTIYALHDGSVAAPTAGLHFTNNVLKNLTDHKINYDFVTLHVGAGTFMPVKSATLAGHEMHAEFIDVSIDLMDKIIDQSQHHLIAVGTTTLRTLESLYWMGVKTLVNADIGFEHLIIKQWDAYELPQHFTKVEAIEGLRKWLLHQNKKRLLTKTQLLIAPGYTIRMADAIITNFHQPQSTLLLLIYAFVGESWKQIYDYALQNNFRFLSYGDGSLLWKQNAAD